MILQSPLSQSQQAAKQKAVEAEEPYDRLEALRNKNSDLEKQLSFAYHQSQLQKKK